MDKLKDYVWVAGLVLIIGGAYTEWRISVAVDAKFQAAGIVSSDKSDAMDGDINENKDDIDGLESRWNNIVDAVAAAGRTDGG